MVDIETGEVTSMQCKTCHSDTDALWNGDCWDCYHPKQVEWDRRMAIRQNPAQFDMTRLVNLLLTQQWMHEARIIPDYMPPYPRPDTRPRCVIEYTYNSGDKVYLRHSCGPLQGYTWDNYGDDFLSPELALIALSQAIAPPCVHAVVPTYGR